LTIDELKSLDDAIKNRSETDKRFIEFKRMFSGMVATSKDAYKKSDAKFVNKRNRVYTREEIDRIIVSGDPIQRA
jgi:hypothetical protein